MRLPGLDIILHVPVEAADIVHPSSEHLLPGDLDRDGVAPLILLPGQADRIGILEHPEFRYDLLGQKKVLDDSLSSFTVLCLLTFEKFP